MLNELTSGTALLYGHNKLRCSPCSFRATMHKNLGALRTLLVVTDFTYHYDYCGIYKQSDTFNKSVFRKYAHNIDRRLPLTIYFQPQIVTF
jgi:hypothetical protein